MNWINYIPPSDNQSSNKADSLACVSFSAIHCIESQELKLLGNLPGVGYSERALAKLSNTTHQGNDIVSVYNAIKKYGLILDSDWPTEIGDFDWPTFYQDIPQEIVSKGQDWLKKWDLELVVAHPDISKAPLWTKINAFPDTVPASQQITHFVEQLNSSQYFDSYQQYVKTFKTTVLAQYQLIIKPKTMNLINDKGTFWIVGDTGKIGIADMSALAKFQKVSSAVTTGDTSSIPVVGIIKQDSQIIIADK